MGFGVSSLHIFPSSRRFSNVCLFPFMVLTTSSSSHLSSRRICTLEVSSPFTGFSSLNQVPLAAVTPSLGRWELKTQSRTFP